MALAFSWFFNISDSNHRNLSVMSSIVLRQVLSEERERYRKKETHREK